jgi:hypothetical protein
MDGEKTTLIQTFVGLIKMLGSRAGVLVTALVLSAPKDLSSTEKRKLELLEKAGKKVDDILMARERASPARLQAPRAEMANAVMALYETLLGFKRLPGASSAKGEECGRIASSLFPQGTLFVKASAPDLYGQVTRLIARIENEAIEKKLAKLIGPEFVGAIRETHHALGEAMGFGGAPVPGSTALAEALLEFQIRLAGYTRALSAEVDEFDEVSVTRFFSAVAPIDELRSRMSSGGDEEQEEEEDGEEPVSPPDAPVVSNPVSPNEPVEPAEPPS